jgi:hypothetical protein
VRDSLLWGGERASFSKKVSSSKKYLSIQFLPHRKHCISNELLISVGFEVPTAVVLKSSVF